jgi:hypothetical protein
MKKYFVLLSAFVMVAFCGCKNIDGGSPVTKSFDIQGTYENLEVSSAFDVFVSDTATQIIVTAGENIMPKVVVKKEGNTLKIYCKPTFTVVNSSEMIVILPYCADLKDVELSGASTMHTPFTLRGEKVEVSLSGSSEYFGNIEANSIDLDLSGASSFEGNFESSLLDLELSGASGAKLIGKTTTLKIDLSGASNIVRQIIDGQYALECDHCEGSMSGASEAYIHCNNSIQVSLSGASELHYTGNALTSGCSVSGGSNISRDGR